MKYLTPLKEINLWKVTVWMSINQCIQKSQFSPIFAEQDTAIKSFSQ